MAVQQEKQLRDFTLSVRLRADMRERLYAVGEALGVSPATIASIAIGQYVATQTATLKASKTAIEGVIAHLGPEMSEIFKTIGKESETPCSSSSVSSVQLPLLAAAPTKKQAKSRLSAKSFKSKP